MTLSVKEAGKRGGKARAAKLTGARRKAISKLANKAKKRKAKKRAAATALVNLIEKTEGMK